VPGGVAAILAQPASQRPAPAARMLRAKGRMRGQENMKRLHVRFSSPDRASLAAISYNRENLPADSGIRRRGWRDEHRPCRGRNMHSSFMAAVRSEEHTSELQSRENLVCRLL